MKRIFFMKRIFVLFLTAVLAFAVGFVLRVNNRPTSVSPATPIVDAAVKKTSRNTCRDLARRIGQGTVERSGSLEALEDSFVMRCPETAGVFPFKKTIFLFGNKGVEEVWLNHGLFIRADGTIGRLVSAKADELQVRLNGKIMTFVLKNDVFVPKGKVIRVKHSSWTDDVLIEDGRFVRLAGSAGDILRQTPLEMTVKWDRWGRETFVFENGVWSLKP